MSPNAKIRGLFDRRAVALVERAPRLGCSWPRLERAYRRSLIDLAAQRFYPLFSGGPPAFARDGLLTALQALPFVPELAETTLRLFARGEPTPLFVVLLDEYERWSGDARLVRELERPARAAIASIDRKRPGRAYDAARRSARLARRVWHDDTLAAQLAREAVELRRSFNREFALTEEPGPLLWSGIVDEVNIDACVAQLEAPYSAWDALGLRAAGRPVEAARVALAILDEECAPGEPLTLIRALLGLEPVDERLRTDPALPSEIERLELRGIPGRWGRTDAIARGNLELG
jgi:hypothetical protein